METTPLALSRVQCGLIHCISCCCLDILRKFDDILECVLPKLPASFREFTDPEGKAALLWILGEYGEVGVACSVLNHTHLPHPLAVPAQYSVCAGGGGEPHFRGGLS